MINLGNGTFARAIPQGDKWRSVIEQSDGVDTATIIVLDEIFDDEAFALEGAKQYKRESTIQERVGWELRLVRAKSGLPFDKNEK